MRIKRLRMPAVAEADDLLGRRPGDRAVARRRYPIEVLNGIRIDDIERPSAWAALYQQRPIAVLGGGMFRQGNYETWKPMVKTADDQYDSTTSVGRSSATPRCWRFSHDGSGLLGDEAQ